MFSVLNLNSVSDEGDLTAEATIRNAALRLFAERGHDARDRRGGSRVAEIFARAFPHGCPLPAYLRRLPVNGKPDQEALLEIPRGEPGSVSSDPTLRFRP
jgi:hypothetical protein